MRCRIKISQEIVRRLKFILGKVKWGYGNLTLIAPYYQTTVYYMYMYITPQEPTAISTLNLQLL